MKLVRIYTGDDGQSHFDHSLSFAFTERDGSRTVSEAAKSIAFFDRVVGYQDFHCPPGKQYLIYLTAQVELGVGDGTTVIMEPGDVLQAEDVTGQGHSSRVLADGLCVVVPLVEQ